MGRRELVLINSFDLDVPIEVPDDVTHRDLYIVLVKHNRRLLKLENDVLSGVPVTLTPFQKWVAGIFLSSCAFIAVTAWNNSTTLAELSATLETGFSDRYTGLQASGDWRAQAIKDAEQDGRIGDLEHFHPRQGSK